tara:strand:- start:2103 stop:3068 length:966 start_codon:yes stop_codon:yes gene_type:complete
MKNILITGITGQDGVFLTSEILKNNSNLNIYGVSRGKNNSLFFDKLNTLIKASTDSIKLLNVDLNDYEETKKLIQDTKPDFVYNLTGPSSVYDSLKNPSVTKSLIINIFDNLTKAIIEESLFSNFYQASSSEMFGIDDGKKLDEKSKFNPNSPYAEAKLDNHFNVLKLAEKYEWNIFSGIMFNHESQFREDNYLFMKIINGAINIKNKKIDKLTLGSLDYVRDWSYAGDTSKAIYKITNEGKSNTYVIGSGKGHQIKNIVEIVFDRFNLDVTKYIDIDESLIRKGDPKSIVSNPLKIQEELNWSSEVSFENLINICIDSRI